MSTPPYPTDCWLTPLAGVGESPIEGSGLFATARITSGDVVMRLGGQLIDDATLAALTAHPARYGNHSCDPSLWHTDAVTVVARRDVAAGEELTIDYATHTGTETWTMACRCGSPRCRRTVTGRDWRLAHLQRAYGRHWSPPLLERIRNEPTG
jgi:hypothetical protein